MSPVCLHEVKQIDDESSAYSGLFENWVKIRSEVENLVLNENHDSAGCIRMVMKQPRGTASRQPIRTEASKYLYLESI